MEENNLEFLPFHAINEFMRTDFRLTVIRAVLNEIKRLSPKTQEQINHLTRKFVKVPGFRNSEKAPPMVKAIPLSNAFEKNPELVAVILSGWVEIHSELRGQLYEVLTARNWKMFPTDIPDPSQLTLPKNEMDWAVLPLDADRTRLPGFVIYWPEGEDYEKIYQTFTEMYPKEDASIDQVGLMTVWLSMRLPYHISGKEAVSVPSPDE